MFHSCRGAWHSCSYLHSVALDNAVEHKIIQMFCRWYLIDRVKPVTLNNTFFVPNLEDTHKKFDRWVLTILIPVPCSWCWLWRWIVTMRSDDGSVPSVSVFAIMKQPLLILNLLKFQLLFRPAVAGSSWCRVAWPQLTWLGCIWSSNLFDVLKLPKNQTLVLVNKMKIALCCLFCFW